MPTLWKPLPRFPHLEISSTGKLRRISNRFTYRNQRNHHGGLNVIISLDGISHTLRVARLVGQAFCPDYRDHLYPRYLDGNKTNCRPENLQWITRAQVTGHPYSRIGARSKGPGSSVEKREASTNP